MLRPFLLVSAIGIVIGLAWPTGQPSAWATAAAADSGSAPVETVLERERNGHFYAHAKVNGQLVRFVVDTGASGVALSMADAERVGIDFSPSEFERIGEGASGPVRGKLIRIDEIELDGKKVENVRGAVLEGSRLSLLGQSYLSRLGGVEISGDQMVLR